MIQKKVCLLGAFAVGKSSLVARFVKSVFSDKYHTTVGVKIDKKLIKVGDLEVSLVLWDLQGEDELQKVRISYLQGSSGYLLVADATRGVTFDKARIIQKTAEEVIGKVPFIFLINKSDLSSEWSLNPGIIEELSAKGWTVLRTSAKTGMGVEEAFTALAKKMLEG
jgi:hypothetical protein